MKKIIMLLFGSALLFAPACDKTEDTNSIDIEAEIAREMEAQNIPSVVACIIKGDEIAWEGTFGDAEVHSSTPATRQTVYTLMSIGKLMLATTVMQLWEEEQLELDADINQYLPFEVRNPRFPDRPITVRMLLTHTSSLAKPYAEDGIPEFERFYSFEEVPLISEWLPEYILPGGSYYRSNVWKDYPPGAQELYSNIGPSLLGLIVEHISGEGYRDYCREHLFEPLNMQQTAFRISELDESLLATPYDNYNRPIPPYTSRHYPAGFIMTNLEDFSHYAIAILNYGEYKGKRILKRSTVEQMVTPHNPASGTAFMWENYLGDCIGHRGGATGFSTYAEWHLGQDDAFFVFSNKVNEAVYPGGRIYDLLRYGCGTL